MTNCKPTKQQLAFLDWEFGAFFHFGLRAFYKGYRDWDTRDMDASVFNPEKLDCASWLRTCKAAGMTYAIMTCKHHDGFANWPTAYGDYSVKNTPWKDGKGDVVREFTDACREVGMKVGLYYSPAQRDQSAFDKMDYDDYFIGQITELLTGYGKIDYLWFDGCGSGNHEWDRPRIIRTIRSLQPDILIFGMWDPNTRWVGNEAGIAPLPYTYIVQSQRISVESDEHTEYEEEMFLPAECDTMMRRGTWFDCEDNEDQIRSLEELMGLYCMSVGHGVNFLLNIGPTREGLLPEKDAARLTEFGEEIRKRFGHPLPSSEIHHDGDAHSITFEQHALVDAVILSEDLTEGEGVKKYAVYANDIPYSYGEVLVYEGYVIGHKAICMFPAVYAKGFTVKVTDARGEYTITRFTAHNTKALA